MSFMTTQTVTIEVNRILEKRTKVLSIDTERV